MKKATAEKLIESLLANGYIEDKPHPSITTCRVFREAGRNAVSRAAELFTTGTSHMDH